MHDLKYIRDNFDTFKKKILNRNNTTNIDNILDLDKKNRKLIQEKELLEKQKKDISKSKDKKMFQESKEISFKIKELSDKQMKAKLELDKVLSSIPNIPHDDVPVGSDEKFNKVVETRGKIITKKFKEKSHFELGEKLNMLDFDIATKTTGSRFVFVKNTLAMMERALSNFMLDVHTQENGYIEVSPPLIASENTMYGTGQLPKFENDQFEIKLDKNDDRKFLIPTAEVILTNIVKNQIINLSELPIRLVASTPCFRKEAGSYGKDTKGMIRQHQI